MPLFRANCWIRRDFLDAYGRRCRVGRLERGGYLANPERPAARAMSAEANGLGRFREKINVPAARFRELGVQCLPNMRSNRSRASKLEFEVDSPGSLKLSVAHSHIDQVNAVWQ